MFRLSMVAQAPWITELMFEALERLKSVLDIFTTDLTPCSDFELLLASLVALKFAGKGNADLVRRITPPPCHSDGVTARWRLRRRKRVFSRAVP